MQNQHETMTTTATRDQLTFYDIPSVDTVKQWSPNTTPIRMLLNYMGVPFTTEWVEYPQIKSALEKVSSIEPYKVDAGKGPTYTVPAIKKGDVGVMDKFKIFEYLSTQYPDQAIVNSTSEKYATAVNEYLGGFVFPKIAFVLSFTPDMLQDKFGTDEYFHETKITWMGLDCKHLKAQSDVVAQSAKELAQELRGFKSLKSVLTKNGIDANQLESGKFLLTSDAPTFADFVLGGVLFWIEQVTNGSTNLDTFEYMDAWTKTWYSEIVKYAL